MIDLQVWCDGEHVGHIKRELPHPGEQLTLIRQPLSKLLDEFSVAELKVFPFAQRTTLIDDMMLEHFPILAIPHYAKAVKMVTKLQTRFSWPILEIGLEDFEAWVFDQDVFEPL